MNNLFWFLLLVVIVGVYFWVKSSDKKHYDKLSPTEKLWSDYQKFNPLCDEGQRIGNELESLLVAMMMASKSIEHLRSIKADFLEISFLKASFWGRAGSSLERVFREKVAEFEVASAERMMRTEMDTLEMMFAEYESQDNKAIQLAREATTPEQAREARKHAHSKRGAEPCEKVWDSLALVAVLQAKTNAELDEIAKCVRPGSAATKALSFMREEISSIEYDQVCGDSCKLAELFLIAPHGGAVEQRAFRALKQFHGKVIKVVSE